MNSDEKPGTAPWVIQDFGREFYAVVNIPAERRSHRATISPMTDVRCLAAGEELLLLPERAVWWPRAGTLFVADTHWGKTAAFRASGIALPGGTTRADLDRLSRCLGRTAASRLVILGDLLHSRLGRDERETLEAVAEWRDRHAALDLLLIRGNHDRSAGAPEEAWRFTVVDEPQPDGPFVFRHFPKPDDRGYVLAGHVHPASRLLVGGESLKLPCFRFGPDVAILPAFSGFADGTTADRPSDDERVFVIADDEVIALPSR